MKKLLTTIETANYYFILTTLATAITIIFVGLVMGTINYFKGF